MTHNTSPDPDAWGAIVVLAIVGLLLGGLVALFVDFFANTPAPPTHRPSPPPTVVHVERDPGADMLAGLLLGGFLAACIASLSKPKAEGKDGEGKGGGTHG